MPPLFQHVVVEPSNPYLLQFQRHPSDTTQGFPCPVYPDLRLIPISPFTKHFAEPTLETHVRHHNTLMPVPTSVSPSSRTPTHVKDSIKQRSSRFASLHLGLHIQICDRRTSLHPGLYQSHKFVKPHGSHKSHSFVHFIS